MFEIFTDMATNNMNDMTFISFSSIFTCVFIEHIDRHMHITYKDNSVELKSSRCSNVLLHSIRYRTI